MIDQSEFSLFLLINLTSRSTGVLGWAGWASQKTNGTKGKAHITAGNKWGACTVRSQPS